MNHSDGVMNFYPPSSQHGEISILWSNSELWQGICDKHVKTTFKPNPLINLCPLKATSMQEEEDEEVMEGGESFE
jgi:hypothetical protein